MSLVTKDLQALTRDELRTVVDNLETIWTLCLAREDISNPTHTLLIDLLQEARAAHRDRTREG